MNVTGGAAMWAVVGIYLVLTIGVGFLAGRKEKNKDLNGFLNSGRSIPPLVLAFSTTATALSGLMFVGTPTQTYNFGWPFYAANMILGGALGMIFAMLVIGRPMRRISEKVNAVTILDLLHALYDTKVVTYIGVPIIIICSVIMCSVQWQCLGNLFRLLGINYSAGVIVGAVVVFAYLVLGGNKSGAVVGAVQVVIAMVAVVFMLWRVTDANGGFVAMNTTLASVNRDFVSFNNQTYPATRFITLSLASFFSCCGQPYVAIKYAQIKDAKLFPKAMAFGVISYIIMGSVILVGLGMRAAVESGVVSGIDKIDSLVPYFIASLSNGWMQPIGAIMGGVIVAAALSAIMSTTTGLMLSASGSMVSDVMDKWLHIDCSGQKGIAFTRIAMAVVMIISIVMALFPMGGIFSVGFAAATMYCVAFAPSMIFGLRWRRATKQGAIASMIVGVIDMIVAVSNTLGLIHWPSTFDVGGTFVAVSFIVFIVVSLMTPATERTILPASRKELKRKTA